MTSHETSSAPRVDASLAHPVIQDRRTKPRGVLPRQTQMWLMVGLAFVILVIIFFTGRPTPASRPVGTGRPTEPALAATDRIRTYPATARGRRSPAASGARPADRAHAAARTGRPSTTEVAPPDPLKDERRRRDVSKPLCRQHRVESPATRPAAERPSTPAVAWRSARAAGRDLRPARDSVGIACGGRGARSGREVPSSSPASARAALDLATTRRRATSTRQEGPRLRLLEGTLIEAVLANRLDGTFAGPVDALVTAPVYSARSSSRADSRRRPGVRRRDTRADRGASRGSP